MNAIQPGRWINFETNLRYKKVDVIQSPAYMMLCDHSGRNLRVLLIDQNLRVFVWYVERCTIRGCIETQRFEAKIIKSSFKVTLTPKTQRVLELAFFHRSKFLEDHPEKATMIFKMAQQAPAKNLDLDNERNNHNL